MPPLAYVAIWVLFSVLVGLAVGYALGANTRNSRQREEATQQRDLTLQALVEMLRSTEQLSTNVDEHSHEMQRVSRRVGGLQVSGELQGIQRALLGGITEILESNQRLEDDLVLARARLEEQAEELDRTRREARTDPVSGVANRKAFDERLQLLLSRWRREAKSFVLILADIDHFKRINDTHGHTAGDGIVRHVGEFLRQIVRPGDYIARYGGDEFALLLPETDLETGLRFCEEIRAQIARSNFQVGPRGEQAAVTFSIGLAAPREGDQAETIIHRADQGLYKSKEGGRNQVNCWRDEAPVEVLA